MRVNGLLGLLVGFVGVIVVTSSGFTGEGSSLTGEIALIGAAISYACGAVYARRNVRGLRPMVPAVFQVTFAMLITAVIALLFEHPWTATPDAEAIFSIIWLGILGSGLAYLLVFRLFAHWGATRTTTGRLRHPGRRHRARLPRARRTESTRASSSGTGLVIAGVALVNSRYGRRRVFGRVPPIEAV